MYTYMHERKKKHVFKEHCFKRLKKYCTLPYAYHSYLGMCTDFFFKNLYSILIVMRNTRVIQRNNTLHTNFSSYFISLRTIAFPYSFTSITITILSRIYI